MTISVLIADDQAMVRAGFAALLDAHESIRVVGQAATGQEAVKLAARLDPDVILMDVRMPELDGIEATRRILGPDYPAARVPRILMLTTFDIDEYVYDALQAGASGFLLKDALPEELVSAVRVVAAGDALLAPSVTRRMIAQFAAQKPRASRVAAVLSDLTEREREVLVLPPIRSLLQQLHESGGTADARRMLDERLADLTRRSVALLAASAELYELLSLQRAPTTEGNPPRP